MSDAPATSVDPTPAEPASAELDSLPDDFTPSAHQRDPLADLEKRLSALEDLATATAEAIDGSEWPRVAAALRKLRTQAR